MGEGSLGGQHWAVRSTHLPCGLISRRVGREESLQAADARSTSRVRFRHPARPTLHIVHMYVLHTPKLLPFSARYAGKSIRQVAGMR